MVIIRESNKQIVRTVALIEDARSHWYEARIGCAEKDTVQVVQGGLDFYLVDLVQFKRVR